MTLIISHTHTTLHSYIFVIYSYVFLYIPIYSYVFLYIPMYSYLYIPMQSYIFLCIHIYSYVFIYIPMYSYNKPNDAHYYFHLLISFGYDAHSSKRPPMIQRRRVRIQKEAQVFRDVTYRSQNGSAV